ncbi:hypothetical protein C8R47DRAFT_1226174 [Mycena vitilis]|nr:hypothetical protein C8R47DRAFT_1226174 [Mycena vitilis]
MRTPSTDAEISTVYTALRQKTPKFPAFATGYLYATNTPSRRTVSVPYNYGVTKIRSTNDLFVNSWIPVFSNSFNVADRSEGRLILTNFPGTSIPLEFSYTVFFVPRGSSGSINLCGSLRCTSAWAGNILVVKCGKRKAVINMEKEDTYLVDNIVSACIDLGLFVALDDKESLLCRGLSFALLIFAHPADRVLAMGHSRQKKRAATSQKGRKNDVKRTKISTSPEPPGPPAAHEFFHIPEMLVMELFFHCTLVTLFSIAKTGEYGRDLVKAFFATNLRLLVAVFLTDTHIDAFFDLLESSLGAIGGSTVAGLLSAPYRHGWTPSNLNIFLPRGILFTWRSWLESLGLRETPPRLGVGRKFQRTSRNHVVYTSFLPGHTIMLTESKDNSVLTILMSATSTWCTNIATCSDFFVLYSKLTNENRALEGWFPTNVRQAVKIDDRGIRNSISTASWQMPCGFHCPILWREIRGFEGVGVFRWGGASNQHADGVSTVGIPAVNDSMTWRLGDACANENCDEDRANYYTVTAVY